MVAKMESLPVSGQINQEDTPSQMCPWPLGCPAKKGHLTHLFRYFKGIPRYFVETANPSRAASPLEAAEPESTSDLVSVLTGKKGRGKLQEAGVCALWYTPASPALRESETGGL